MKKLLLILILYFATGIASAAGMPQGPEEKGRTSRRAVKRSAKEGKMQYSGRDVSHYDFELDSRGDTTTVVYISRIFCFSKPVDMSRHWKMVRDFRKVYPLALLAKDKMAGFEEQMLKLPSRKAQRDYSKRIEKELVEEYSPVMKRMTVNQGKILVRLIDRETDMTSYEVIKEFRGGFVAGFWQGMAKIFGHNLKDEYDALERDRIIEQCIMLYNAGLLPEY